ncbi:hypothetical protein CAEBREN_10080 [Caenorhabditis brenneri]|uniref:Uncharacterized protein n=1 Tax=Caenorhabditis brenneri TaxID=135651 RepID=G0NI12_CAEBE|nr:hypothetical protein CAEBREN_10080 [Caenorhabditis brenneri]
MDDQSTGNDATDVASGVFPLNLEGIVPVAHPDTNEIMREKEEQRIRFEAKKEAWQNEKKELNEKLDEANKTIDALKKENENQSIKHKQETEELGRNHEAEVKVLNGRITEFTEYVDILEKFIEDENDGISNFVACHERAKMKRKSKVEEILNQRSAPKDAKESEIDSRKRKGEEAESDDKKHPKLDDSSEFK